MTPSIVYGLYDEWNWTPKQPVSFVKAKYSVDNIVHMIEFVQWVQQQPLIRLKFLDESHFEPTDLEQDVIWCERGIPFVLTLQMPYSIRNYCLQTAESQHFT